MTSRFPVPPNGSCTFVPDEEPRFILSIPFATSISTDSFLLPCLSSLNGQYEHDPRHPMQAPSPSPDLSYVDHLLTQAAIIGESKSSSSDLSSSIAPHHVAFVKGKFKTKPGREKRGTIKDPATGYESSVSSRDKPTDYDPTLESQFYNRPQRARIYGQESFTWYESQGQDPLLEPPSIPTNGQVVINNGDIVVHKYLNNSAAQVWLWNDQCWHSIQVGDACSICEQTYVFNFGKDFYPRWASLKTVERSERRRRNRDPQPAA